MTKNVATLAPSHTTTAPSTKALSPLKSVRPDAVWACCPPWNARYSTKNMATTSAPTNIQSFELKRPFITSSNILCRALDGGSQLPKISSSNRRDGERLGQSPQIQRQRQTVLMAQHAATMGNIARRFFGQQWV